MVYITGVSKCFYGRGRNRKHHPRGKKHWRVFGYRDDGSFFSYFTNEIGARIAQLKRVKLQSFQCLGCGAQFRAEKGSKPSCPNGCSIEDSEDSDIS